MDVGKNAYNMSEQKMKVNINKNRIATVYIILGIIIEVISLCFTYAAQYFDMQVNGTAYADLCEYLKEPPLVFVVII